MFLCKEETSNLYWLGVIKIQHTRIYHYYCYYTYLGINSLYDTFPPNHWVSWTITVTQFFSTGELFCFHRNVSWLISQTFPTKGMREYKMHLWTLSFSSVAWLKKEVQSIPELPTKIKRTSGWIVPFLLWSEYTIKDYEAPFSNRNTFTYKRTNIYYYYY